MLKFLVLTFAFFTCAFAQESADHRFPSPDSQLVAVVKTASSTRPNIPGEGIVELRDKKGHLLLKRSYTSQDGQHGFVLNPIGWTANSQFFVYSMSSSGGHQPWNNPVGIYRRTTNTIYPLEKYFGPITGVVSMAAPDSLFFAVYRSPLDRQQVPQGQRISLDSLFSKHKGT